MFENRSGRGYKPKLMDPSGPWDGANRSFFEEVQEPWLPFGVAQLHSDPVSGYTRDVASHELADDLPGLLDHIIDFLVLQQDVKW